MNANQLRSQLCLKVHDNCPSMLLQEILSIKLCASNYIGLWFDAKKFGNLCGMKKYGSSKVCEWSLKSGAVNLTAYARSQPG